MKAGRFKTRSGEVRWAIQSAEGRDWMDLTSVGIHRLSDLLQFQDLIEAVHSWEARGLTKVDLTGIEWLAPVDEQEVWAAGVTYLRSKTARMEESEFSASAYDRVYEAPRPELFFKSMPHKVVRSGDAVGIRKDARWNVPEPELVLFFNSHGKVSGYGIGNDMSSRDIEGENLLYLPQAKVYDKSCSMGPWIVLNASEEDARTWTIQVTIQRANSTVFEGQTAVSQIKRSFAELGDYLFRSQTFDHGVALLTGTGVVPPDSFTLEPGDLVTIEISGIGRLENQVVLV